jgi:hypothetical protein
MHGCCPPLHALPECPSDKCRCLRPSRRHSAIPSSQPLAVPWARSSSEDPPCRRPCTGRRSCLPAHELCHKQTRQARAFLFPCAERHMVPYTLRCRIALAEDCILTHHTRVSKRDYTCCGCLPPRRRHATMPRCHDATPTAVYSLTERERAHLASMSPWATLQRQSSLNHPCCLTDPGAFCTDSLHLTSIHAVACMNSGILEAQKQENRHIVHHQSRSP